MDPPVWSTVSTTTRIATNQPLLNLDVRISGGGLAEPSAFGLDLDCNSLPKIDKSFAKLLEECFQHFC
jgi:hypothetical protein